MAGAERSASSTALTMRAFSEVVTPSSGRGRGLGEEGDTLSHSHTLTLCGPLTLIVLVLQREHVLHILRPQLFQRPQYTLH